MPIRQQLFSPVNAFIQGEQDARQARQSAQQEQYGQSRNALAQMEVEQAPRDIANRNALAERQLKQFTDQDRQANIQWQAGAAEQVLALPPDQQPQAAAAMFEEGKRRGIVQPGAHMPPFDPQRYQQAVADAKVQLGQGALTSQQVGGFNVLRQGEKVIASAAPKQATPDDLTDRWRLEVKERGYKGSLLDYQKELKAAGATQVSVNGKMEDAASKAFGEAEGKAFGDVIQRGQDAADKASSLRSMSQNPAITGPTQDFRAAAGSLFADLGIPVSPDRVNQIANLGQYKAIANQLVLTEQLKQKGPQTESDAKRIAESFGKTTNIQETNKLILNYQLALADRETLLSQMAEEYRQRTGKIDGWRGELRQYVRSTPLAGVDPQSKRLVFWNEFMEGMKEDNPSMDDEQILGYWRKRYGR